jgi:hypothetical protein
MLAAQVAGDINLTYGAVCIYCSTMPTFFDAWPAVATLRNDLRVGKTLELGHQEWERQTGLPGLRSRNDWRTVAFKVGASDELIERAVEDGEPEAIRKLGLRITAYAKPLIREPYLGITLCDREASREWNGKTYGPVTFGRSEKLWQLFTMLVMARETGIHRRELEDQLGQVDHAKTRLLLLIQPLKLGIGTGMWKLRHVGK